MRQSPLESLVQVDAYDQKCPVLLPEEALVETARYSALFPRAPGLSQREMWAWEAQEDLEGALELGFVE